MLCLNQYPKEEYFQSLSDWKEAFVNTGLQYARLAPRQVQMCGECHGKMSRGILDNPYFNPDKPQIWFLPLRMLHPQRARDRAAKLFTPPKVDE